MAQYKFSVALNASSFPLVTRFQPRSVMIGQMDGHLRDPSKSLTDPIDNNPQNIPQVIYCENVMPTMRGCKSVGYAVAQAAFPGAGTANDTFIIRNGGTESWFYSPAQGMNYVTSALGTPWVSTNPLPGAPLATKIPVSIAEVNGITYVNYFGAGLFQWDGVNFIDCSGTLLGIGVAGIRSICSSGNYLCVCYSDNSIKWSSLTNPLDFVPSTISGAGSQIPIDMRGTPYYLSQIAGGFLIHCSENTVAAVYTQNVAQPWIFREIRNSGGIVINDDFSGISRQTSTGNIYEYGTAGLQQMDLRDATLIHPQVTDFFSDKTLEVFDYATNLLSQAIVAARFIVKVSFLSSRFLCLSYGQTIHQYNYALIYDSAQRRWGKLKVDHACIFTNPDATVQSDALYIQKFNGSCEQIVLDNRAQTDQGVVILGKYQLSRTNLICSEEFELEVQDANEAPDVFIAADYDGTTVGELDQMLLYSTTVNYRRYQKQIEAMNLSYIVKGVFNLTTALITATKGARAGS